MTVFIIIGVVILGILIAIIYTLGSVVDLYMDTIGNNPSWDKAITDFFGGIDLLDWKLFVVAPLWLIVVLIGIIAIWIGWSMLTTPAPVPLEELEEELEAELRNLPETQRETYLQYLRDTGQLE